MASATSRDAEGTARRWLSAAVDVSARLAEVGGWAFAVLGILAFAGSLWWIFDLIADVRPHLTVLLALLAAVTALRRDALFVKWSPAGIGAAALLNAALVAPYVIGTAAPVPDDATTIRVISFNVGISNPDRDRVARWVADERPDVVFLYESSFEWEDSLLMIDTGLAMVAVVPPTRLSGITVLARRDLLPEIVAGTPFDVSEGVAVRIIIDGTPIEILGLHPASPTSAARSSARDALLASAGDWVAGRGDPVLVVGDLNATPWSHGFRTLERRGGLRDSLRGRGLQGSWPSGLGPLMIPIDHALTTDGLLVADRRLGPAFGSAHRSLLVTVAPEAGP